MFWKSDEVRVRIVWDLPADDRTYSEVGKFFLHIGLISETLSVEHADLEGFVLLVRSNGEVLKETIEELSKSFSRVSVIVEEGE